MNLPSFPAAKSKLYGVEPEQKHLTEVHQAEGYRDDSRMLGAVSGKQQTYRTEASSEVSMGEMIQREQEYKKALGEQKGKKFIPARIFYISLFNIIHIVNLPSFSAAKSNLYGVDAKYVGSPRDLDLKSDRDEDDKASRSSSKKVGGKSTTTKVKIPALKVSFSRITFLMLDRLEDYQKKKSIARNMRSSRRFRTVMQVETYQI